MSYHLIYTKFCTTCQENRDQFNNAITLAFNEAKEIDPIGGINQMFRYILTGRTNTPEEVKYMIELSADPKTIDHNIQHFCTHFLIHNNNTKGPDILRILLDHGLVINPYDIKQLVAKKNFLDVLIERNYEILEELSLNDPHWIESEVIDFIIDQVKTIEKCIEPHILAKLFIIVMHNDKLDTDIIELFINAGLNPRYNNDLLFVESCKNTDISLPCYLINNYGADVNAYDGDALVYAIENKHPRMIKMLLEMSIKITDKHIKSAFVVEVEYIGLLLNYSDMNYEHLARLIIQRSLNLHKYYNIYKMLVDSNIDFTHLIRDECNKYQQNDTKPIVD